jgi:uncharacterized protein YgbK (DUF1537 family)
MTGVIADDTTGALDIGVMFHRAGCRVQMLLHPARVNAEPGVTIIDTDSRLDPADVAYAKVYAATRTLLASGARRFHKKTCSVFRGNIGAEFDALLDAVGAPQAIVSAAYPLLGRTTRAGRQRVDGRLLEDSVFARDPVHPRRTSDLVALIGEQSQRRSTVIPLGAVRSGPAALRSALAAAAAAGATYLVVDGETQADLATLAEASTAFHVFAGSAGFALEWPRAWPGERSFAGEAFPATAPAGRGVLVVCGSLMPQSRAQVAHLLAEGVANGVFPGAAAFDAVERTTLAETLANTACHHLARGEPFLLATDSGETAPAAARGTPSTHLAESAALGKAVSAALAAIVARIVAHTPPAGLIVAGGDTSGAVARALGVRGCTIIEELCPGVPLCAAFDQPFRVVLKSGSFGPPDFLARALRRLSPPVAA